MSSGVDFTIVTPSLNMLDYLKRCCASIADQDGVTLEHIVIDGGSTDGTAEWLSQNKHIVSVSQSDKGMYDAINRGLDLARGDIIAYLNCDEQYLGGTLSFVKSHFDSHPRVDVIFGDALLVKPDGFLLSFRKGYQPRWYYMLASHLYVLSCTMFLRRKIVDDGVRFDESLKAVGDLDFVVRVLRRGYHATHVSRYMATFAVTGQNLGASRKASIEAKQVLRSVSLWVRLLKWPLNIARLLEKLASGAYWQEMPLEYAIYVGDETTTRSECRAEAASFRWPSA